MKKNQTAFMIECTTDHKTSYKNVDVIFVGFGIPEQPDGSANLSYIVIILRHIAENIKKDCLVVVKSTVLVVTNDKVEQLIKTY